MVDIARRFLGVGLTLSLLAGCAQSSELSKTIPLEAQDTNFSRLTPGLHPVTFTSFADGKLALENGCFRLVKRHTSLAIIWPETAIVVRDRQIIRIEDHAARWSAGIGDRIRLGGREAGDISALELSNEGVRNCAGPYFVASNVIRRRRLF
jgi:hypothetical protein